MIQAAIFDLDGTLVDSEILWVESVECFLAERGHPVSRKEAESIIYGVAWEHVCGKLMDQFPDLALTVETMYAGLQQHYNRLITSRDILIPGSIHLLKQLAATMPVCVVSGSFRNDIAYAAERAGILSHLAFFLGDEDYSPGKPNPAAYLLAAEKLQVTPENCVVFEDSTVGIQGAKNAGMACVALARPGRPQQDVSPADWVLTDLRDFDLESLVRKLDPTRNS